MKNDPSKIWRENGHFFCKRKKQNSLASTALRECEQESVGLKVWSRDSLLMCWKVLKTLRTAQMIQINVLLPNGHAELLTLLPSSTVQDVRTKAERAFGKRYLRLITAKNRVLVDPDRTLEEAEIEDGEFLTALVLQPQLAATKGAFALWCHGAQRNRCLGSCRLWRWHFGSSRSAQWCEAGSSHKSSICRDSGRWIRGYLGSCKLWRRQFGSSRSAQGCEADSSHSSSICCDSGRWIRRYLGWCMLWRRTVPQFGISSRVCSRFKPHAGHLLRFWQMDTSLPGVVQNMAVTVRQFEISSGVCSKFKPQLGPLLRFWQMDPSLLGVMETLVVTVQQFKISSGLSSRFRREITRLLRFWQMDPSSLGVILSMAVTVRQFEISFGVCSKFKPHTRHLLRFWQMDTSLPGGRADYGGNCSAVRDQLRGVQQIQATVGAFAAILADGSRYLGWCMLWRRQFRSSGSAQGCAADSGHRWCLCCDSGRWIRRYLGSSTPWWWQFGSSRSAPGVCSKFQATVGAFAAILLDGSVVTWGDRRPWRWQFGCSRSAQVCEADSSHRGLCCGSWRLVTEDSSAVQKKARFV